MNRIEATTAWLHVERAMQLGVPIKMSAAVSDKARRRGQYVQYGKAVQRRQGHFDRRSKAVLGDADSGEVSGIPCPFPDTRQQTKHLLVRRNVALYAEHMRI